MYIISKHKDYYDYLSQIYGVDKKVVYHRHPAEEEAITQTFFSERKLNRNSEENNYQFYFDEIWLCDEVYPLIRVSRSYSDETLLYYSYEHLIADWPEVKPAPSKWVYKDMFEEHFVVNTSKAKYNTKYASPQLLAHRGKVYKDIILKDYDFQRVMSPEQVFQLVAMFMAAQPEPPQTIPTDLHRFEAKGFDKKTSFRNM